MHDSRARSYEELPTKDGGSELTGTKSKLAGNAGGPSQRDGPGGCNAEEFEWLAFPRSGASALPFIPVGCRSVFLIAKEL